ncbi:hypothetical protein GSI_03288 [Ganoderma sinense ZZ0214-1]|uniref:DUF6533 domain-containing protein n=1 Tax=Ganoderma sinense ZZ0214-1 TaxID=1077348 RepID=A0A2G8SL81_9APHY|nr:hypothetical protein GSI_03288 [Ganoderma sinense ZZ0214-1]
MTTPITFSAEDLSSLVTSIHCNNSALTILVLDRLLCLDQEVACIWKAAGSLNAGSLVYAFSRFALMTGLVFNTANIFPLSLPCSQDSVCSQFPDEKLYQHSSYRFSLLFRLSTVCILALLNVLQIILTAVFLDAIDAKESHVTIFIDP